VGDYVAISRSLEEEADAGWSGSPERPLAGFKRGNKRKTKKKWIIVVIRGVPLNTGRPMMTSSHNSD